MEILVLVLIVQWVGGAILTGHVAEARGYSSTAWGWGAALLFTPLLGLIAVAALPRRERPAVAAAVDPRTPGAHS
jgi:hypothetical protein